MKVRLEHTKRLSFEDKSYSIYIKGLQRSDQLRAADALILVHHSLTVIIVALVIVRNENCLQLFIMHLRDTVS